MSRRLGGPAVLALGFAVVAGCGGARTDPAAGVAAKCATPRTGFDPVTSDRYPDTQGTLADEKAWLRAWTDDLYLWYREVPASDPATFATAIDYFNVLRTTSTTASGKPKDQFHFTIPTAEWQLSAGSGISAGYGVQWTLISARPPRVIVAAYVEPGSPAADPDPGKHLARGAKVLVVDGVDAIGPTDGGLDVLNEGLFPTTLGTPHTFTVLDVGATVPRTVTLTSADVTSHPVLVAGPLPPPHQQVGYLAFNAHIKPAEAALVTAVQGLADAGVTDLVLDLRYNGGGYLAVASELGFQVAGPDRTAGKVFEAEAFNDQHGNVDPYTQQTAKVGFNAKTIGFSVPAGQPLPTLNLSRVFVLTSGDTCSASEAVINGLKGVGVQVVQIGSTTCGKPYGFYPADNCGTTYFSIQFQGVNDVGFGDYADGFVPGGTGVSGLPGCQVADDFTHALGDPAEARLQAALAYRATPGTCPPASFPLRLEGSPPPLDAVDGHLRRSSPWLENRILDRR